MIILFISSIIIEIINIIKDPNSIYGNVWGIFRFFTIDGNLLTCIFNIITINLFHKNFMIKYIIFLKIMWLII